jgi:hypothetical protein
MTFIREWQLGSKSYVALHVAYEQYALPPYRSLALTLTTSRLLARRQERVRTRGVRLSWDHLEHFYELHREGTSGQGHRA